MSFFQYKAPNSLQPPPQKGAFGAIGGKSRDGLKLVGSAPFTNPVSGMFTYQPGAQPKIIGWDYSPTDMFSDAATLFTPGADKNDSVYLTDSFSIPASSQSENGFASDAAQYFQPVFSVREGIVGGDSDNMVYPSLIDSISFSDVLSVSLSGICAVESFISDFATVSIVFECVENVSLSDVTNYTLTNFTILENVSDTDSRSAVYANLETLSLSDELSLPRSRTTANETVSMSDNQTIPKYANVDSLTISETIENHNP